MKNCSMNRLFIVFDQDDVQELSVKHFGDKLTSKELDNLETICDPDSWSRVDDGGYEGCLAQLLQSVISIIGLVRVDRRR